MGSNDFSITCFITLVQLNQYSKAAKYLSVTQQTLENNIRQLEDSISGSLVVKSNDTPLLTEIGKLYYHTLCTYSKNMNKFIEYAELSKKNTVIIAYNDWFGCTTQIQTIIDSYQMLHPEITIRYVVNDEKTIDQMLTEGLIDIHITTALNLRTIPMAYTSVPLTEEKLYLLYCPVPHGADIFSSIGRMTCFDFVMGHETEDLATSRLIRVFSKIGNGILPARFHFCRNWRSVFIDAYYQNGLIISSGNENFLRVHPDIFASVPLDLKVSSCLLWNSRSIKPSAAELANLISSQLGKGKHR